MLLRKSYCQCHFLAGSSLSRYSLLLRYASSSSSRDDFKEKLRTNYGKNKQKQQPNQKQQQQPQARSTSVTQQRLQEHLPGDKQQAPASQDDGLEMGTVVNYAKGVVTVHGVENARIGSVIAFDSALGLVKGIVMQIESQVLSVVLLSHGKVVAGDRAVIYEPTLSVPCGEGYAGRVVNALGVPLDDKGSIQGMCYEAFPFKQRVPSIPERMPIEKTLRSGVKHIDFLHPIARGLRVGVFGGPNTGRFELINDIISNLQYSTETTSTGAPEPLHVVYVLIGQSAHQLSKLQGQLEKSGAMQYSTIVCGLSSDPAALQYIAPWTGALLANLHRDNGRHALIVYDDFATHSRVYRSVCRFSAYPAITNSHAWLLEHSAQLDRTRGGGSCTALVSLETETEASSESYKDQLSSFLDHVIVLDSASAVAKNWPPLDCRSYLGRPASRFLPTLFRSLRIALNERLRQSEVTANHFSWARSFGVDQSNDVDMAIVSYRDKVQELLVQPKGSYVSTTHLLIILTAAVEGLPELHEIPEFENDLVSEFEKQYSELNSSLKALKWEAEIPDELRQQLTLAVRKLSERWNVQRVVVASE